MINFDETENEMKEEKNDKNLVLARFGKRVGTLLIEYGFDSLDEVREAKDEDLKKIPGIGGRTLKNIRFRQETSILNKGVGVSDDTATVESEVKPETEAETVGDYADNSSTVEASPTPIGVVAIRSLWPAAMKLVGPSGTEYFWPNAGAEVNVVAEDVEFVLSRNRSKGRACCGGDSERIKFELA